MANLDLTSNVNKGQNMQNAYNPTHLITTYASIIKSPIKQEIERNYSLNFPQIDFPLNFSITFDLPNPYIPGHLSLIIDHIISILDAKPSLNILTMTIFSYSNKDFVNTSISIMLKPDQTINYEDAQSIANPVKYNNWDHPIQINLIPNKHILFINMHEQY